jgi:HEAT repeat protein
MDKAAELIRTLAESDDYFERQRAAWALVEVGEPAVGKLIEALEKGEFSDLRYKAAWILGKIGSPGATDPLCGAMASDCDEVVREWCAAALEAVGDERAIPFLVEAVKKDSSKDVRLRAAVALRNLKATAALRDLLCNVEAEARGLAVTGLAKLRCREALEEVTKLLEDEDREVRRRAAAYMGSFSCREALEALALACKDSSWEVRAEAMRSLAGIKGQEACALAIAALRDEDAGVRLAAVTGLGEIGDSAAVEPLAEVMLGGDEEEIRAWAAWSLGEIGDERAIPLLLKAHKTCPMQVMKMAKESLVGVFKVEP